MVNWSGPRAVVWISIFKDDLSTILLVVAYHFNRLDQVVLKLALPPSR